MTNKTIKYYTREVYGSKLNYLVAEAEDTTPIADSPAYIIPSITGHKTISSREIELFTRLGLQFERVFEPENAAQYR